MKRVKYMVSAALVLSLLLGGCGQAAVPSPGVDGVDELGKTGGAPLTESTVPPEVPSFEIDLPDKQVTTFEIQSGVADGVRYDQGTNTCTVTAAGEYDCYGDLFEGQLVVDAPDDAVVVLNLNGCLLTNSAAAPVSLLNADKVEISAKKGTENKIYDLRTPAEGEDPSGGAVCAECDLTLKGNGSLEVISNYNNGVHTKNDLKIKNLTLSVMAPNNALRGNDSVTVESGAVTAVSSAGDGIKTSSTGLSKKGEQRGAVNLLGGTVTLYAAHDGIDAASDVNISGDVALDIYTDQYSPWSAVGESVSQQALPGMAGAVAAVPGGTAVSLSAPVSPDAVSGATPPADDARGGKGHRTPDGTAPDGRSPEGFDRGEMPDRGGFDRENMPDRGGFDRGGMPDGGGFGHGGKGGFGGSNKTSLAYSCKGIKAANSINISGGTVTIQSTDDGLHANFDEVLESTGQNGLGNVTISGGSVTVSSGDDGVHADQDLVISGGEVTVLTSYEGLEGNRLYLSGGSVTVSASDDAVNANNKGAYQGYIEISGGFLDASVPSGDTDTLDSNGTILISGGTVFLKNGQTGGQSFAGGTIDCERGITVTGGTVIAVGCIGERPQGAVYDTAQAFESGDYTIQDGAGNTLASFSLESSYRAYLFWSERFVSGQNYTVCRNGSALFQFVGSAPPV